VALKSNPPRPIRRRGQANRLGDFATLRAIFFFFFIRAKGPSRKEIVIHSYLHEV
jgi:hypothetical protein